MNRLIKLSKLLKISLETNSAEWSAVISEVESEALPDYPELKQIMEAGMKADELKVKAAEASNVVSGLDQQGLEDLRNAAKSGELDAMIAQLQAKSARISSRQKDISKRAGFFGSMFSIGGRLLPVIGLIWSGYYAYHDWLASEAAAATIRSHFGEFGSGDDLFHPDYISGLIQKNKEDPEKMLSLAKLNKVAKFYKVENIGKWLNGAMALLSVIDTIAVFAPGGAIAVMMKGFYGGILVALGIGAGAADAAVEVFGQLTEGFSANSEAIKTIATEKIGSQVSQQPEDIEGYPETIEEGPEA